MQKQAPLKQLFIDFDFSLFVATLNMAIALALGAIIGSERQLRGRMAGLRTNALVSLGAAAFVTFAALFPTDINPTRVAAQVVSGIGFLGAGIIFRDGFNNIKGINTAATLWCSAAVGLISGTGHMSYAIALTALIVFTNLGLRPIVRKLKRIAAKDTPSDHLYQLRIGCHDEGQKDIRNALFDSLGVHGLTLAKTVARGQDGSTQIIVLLAGVAGIEEKLEQIVLQMSRNPSVVQADWVVSESGEVDFER